MEQQTNDVQVRIFTVTFATNTSSSGKEITRVLAEEVKNAGFRHVRHVTIKADQEYLQTLLTGVAHDNEADVLLIVGGTGFGPEDHVIESLHTTFERQIEGFSDAYRLLLRDLEADRTDDVAGITKRAVRALLARATAGVYHECLAIAFSGSPIEVKNALTRLVLPALPEAVARATGKLK